MVGPIRGGGEIKSPEPLRKEEKNMIKNKCPEPHEIQEKVTKKYCLLCSMPVKIYQPKNARKKGLLIIWKYWFSNLNLTKNNFCIFYLFIIDHFQAIKKLRIFFEPLSSRGGGTLILVVRPLRQPRLCVSFLREHVKNKLAID